MGYSFINDNDDDDDDDDDNGAPIFRTLIPKRIYIDRTLIPSFGLSSNYGNLVCFLK